MVFWANKPLGISTHRFVHEIGKARGEKVTHTGSLDPLAQGVVVVLSGGDRYHKELYSDAVKLYTFGILVGFETDSFDLLGLAKVPAYLNQPTVREKELKEVCASFIGDYHQLIPQFSARRIQGESFFDRAKRGEKVPDEYQDTKVVTLSLERIEIIKRCLVR